MKKNGFITSALLYGLLALFLTLMLGSLAILANRKMSMDSLKQAALDDVGSGESITSFINIWETGVVYELNGYVSDPSLTGVFTTNSTSPSIVIDTSSYNNITGVYLKLVDNVSQDTPVTVYYSNSKTFTESQKVSGTITNLSSSVAFRFAKGDYRYFKLVIGNKVGLAYKIGEVNLIIQS